MHQSFQLMKGTRGSGFYPEMKWLKFAIDKRLVYVRTYIHTYMYTYVCKGQDALSRHTHGQHKQQCKPNYSKSLLLANATLAVRFVRKSCLHTECDAGREECQCCHKELSMTAVKEEKPSNNSIQLCVPRESFSLISHVAQCQQVTTGTSDPSGMHSLVNEGTNTPPSCPEITLHPQ